MKHYYLTGQSQHFWRRGGVEGRGEDGGEGEVEEKGEGGEEGEGRGEEKEMKQQASIPVCPIPHSRHFLQEGQN